MRALIITPNCAEMQPVRVQWNYSVRPVNGRVRIEKNYWLMARILRNSYQRSIHANGFQGRTVAEKNARYSINKILRATRNCVDIAHRF